MFPLDYLVAGYKAILLYFDKLNVNISELLNAVMLTAPKRFLLCTFFEYTIGCFYPLTLSPMTYAVSTRNQICCSNILEHRKYRTNK